jgi:hypothetical protein
LMLTIFWDSWDLPGTWNNCHKWNLLWHASGRAEACNLLQKKRETVRECHVVARECPTPYFDPHVGNPQQIEVGSHAQPKTFNYDGIKQLVGRWEKCVEKQGITAPCQLLMCSPFFTLSLQ